MQTLTEQLDSLYSTTWQIMKTKAVDNIFNATPLTYWLYKGGRVKRESGGRWIGQQLMYAKNTTVKSLGPGGKVNITNTDPLTTAVFNWKLLAGSVIRLHSDDTENTGKEAMMNLADSKLKNLELSMIDAMEGQLMGDGTGNGGQDLDGLGLFVPTNPALGVVGGIDRAVAANAWWRSFHRDVSVTGMITGDNTYAFNLRKTYNAVSIGNDHPTMIISGLDVYEGYESALTVLLRIYDASMGDAGFEALKFKGAALTYSPSHPAGAARLLNERYIGLTINTHADFAMTDWKPIPDQLDRVAQVILKGNLVMSNGRMQGHVSGWT